MFIVELIVGIFAVTWTLGGCFRCIQRYREDEFDDYGIWRTILCHILEGPISWVIGFMIVGFILVSLIEDFIKKDKRNV